MVSGTRESSPVSPPTALTAHPAAVPPLPAAIDANAAATASPETTTVFSSSLLPSVSTFLSNLSSTAATSTPAAPSSLPLSQLLNLIHHLVSPPLNFSPHDVATLLSSTPSLSAAASHPNATTTAPLHAEPPLAIIPRTSTLAGTVFSMPPLLPPTTHSAASSNPSPHLAGTAISMSEPSEINISPPLYNAAAKPLSPSPNFILSAPYISHPNNMPNFPYENSQNTPAISNSYHINPHCPISNQTNLIPPNSYPSNLNPSLMSTKLTSENYLMWKYQFELILGSHDLLGYIDGTISCPNSQLINSNGELVPNSSYNAWLRTDRTVRSWMNATMTPSIIQEVYTLHTARDVWLTLERRFRQQSLAKKLQYKSEFTNIKKGDFSCDAYLSKLKSLADHLASVNSPVSQMDLVIQALHGLPSEFESFVTAITLQPTIISFDDLRAQLLQFEHRLRAISSLSPPTPAFLASSTSSGGSRGGSRGRGSRYGRGRGRTGRGHPSPQPHSVSAPTSSRAPRPSSGPGILPTPTSFTSCQICGRSGHAALSCSNRFNHAYISEDLPQSFSAVTTAETSDLTWYPDSGATAHMTPDAGHTHGEDSSRIPFS